MTELWAWVLIACGIAYATKMAGYLVPDSVLDRPWVASVSTGMTVGLLTSLVVANTFVTGTAVVLDARVAALAAAAIALWLKAPYLVSSSWAPSPRRWPVWRGSEPAASPIRPRPPAGDPDRGIRGEGRGFRL